MVKKKKEKSLRALSEWTGSHDLIAAADGLPQNAGQHNPRDLQKNKTNVLVYKGEFALTFLCADNR